MKFLAKHLTPAQTARWSWGLLPRIMTFVLIWMAAATSVYFHPDADFGWHLGAGRHILAHGIPSHDVFTYTASSFRWIDHEWLSDVITAALYNHGTLVAVAAAFGLVWTLALGVATRWRWPVAAIGFVALVGQFWPRPTAWTALFLALEFVVWQSFPTRRWLTLPLMLVWVNLHGGFSLGLVVLVALIVWHRQWRQAWLIPAAILTTFINPYGPRLYVEIWRTLSDTSLAHTIAEWQPLHINATNIIMIAAVASAAAILRQWRRLETWLALILLGAAVQSTREFLPFVIVGLMLVGDAYSRSVDWTSHNNKLGFVVAGGSAALALAAFTQLNSARAYFPARAVQSLRKQPCSGHMFNAYNFGGYLIWQLPATPDYIDGRMPSWRDDQGHSYMQRYLQVVDGGKLADQEFARYDITCALLYDSSTLAAQLKREGWRADVDDGTATLWRIQSN